MVVHRHRVALGGVLPTQLAIFDLFLAIDNDEKILVLIAVVIAGDFDVGYVTKRPYIEQHALKITIG
jgi:hypothetical protein